MTEHGTPETLSGKQRRQLRAMGHHLKPVLIVGKEGVFDSLMEQVERELEAHELIKMKVLESAPADPRSVAEEIATGARAHLAQVLGRTALLYRARVEEPAIVLT